MWTYLHTVSTTLVLSGRFVPLADLHRILLIAGLLFLLLLRRQNLSRNSVEHFLDVLVVLGARFEQLDLHLLGESLRVLSQHHFPVWHVVFIANFIYQENQVLKFFCLPTTKSEQVINVDDT